MTTPTLSQIPLLFRWNVADGLNGQQLLARSFSTELAGVLTRTSPKRVADRNGLLYALPQGLPPLTWINGESAMLLEAARTNLCIRSENFGTGWTQTGTGTRTAAVSTASGVTLDLLDDTDAAVATAWTQTVTFTGNGEKSFSIFLKAGTAATSVVKLRAVGVADRGRFQVTWTNGVPSVVATLGTLHGVRPMGDGVYRVLCSAPGVIAAETNSFQVYPVSDGVVGSTGSVLAGGAQAEDSPVPSSYMRTEGSTLTRNVDAVQFPFPAPPQSLTIYVRGREFGTAFLAAETRLLALSASPLATASLRIDINSSGFYRVRTVTAAGAAESGLTTKPSVGDAVEFRVTLSAAGVPRIHQCINGGTEASATAGSAVALDPTWSGQLLHLGGIAGANAGQFAFTHVAVAAGERSLDTMRALAGV